MKTILISCDWCGKENASVAPIRVLDKNYDICINCKSRILEPVKDKGTPAKTQFDRLKEQMQGYETASQLGYQINVDNVAATATARVAVARDAAIARNAAWVAQNDPLKSYYGTQTVV